VRIDHFRVAKPDGTGGCQWAWYVKTSALARLGIAPPDDPAI